MPNLYRGQPVPFHQLDPDRFEQFCLAVFRELGERDGYEVVAGSLRSADSGFDVSAKRKSDGRIIAIQCKRYQAAVTLPQAADEAAKVALASAFEGSTVAQHIVVTTSRPTRPLASALRESAYLRLFEAAREVLDDPKKMDQYKSDAIACGVDPHLALERYKASLELFRVLSIEDFDVEIGRVWSRIIPVLDRFFALDVLVREHPRPDFDRNAYLKRILGEASLSMDLPLRVVPRALPPNIRRTNAADPLSEVDDRPDLDAKYKDPRTSVQPIIEAGAGTCQLIVGSGGAGKTSTLRLGLRVVAERALNDVMEPLPVFVSLRGYGATCLVELIHRTLGIRFGDFRSIPGPVLLLLDGLDEVPTNSQQLLDELDQLLGHECGTRAVVTVRNGGLRRPVSLDRFGQAWALERLNSRDIVKLVERKVPAERREDCLRAVWELAWQDDGFELLSLPFGMTTALDLFLRDGLLADSSAGLIERFLTNRFRRNRHSDRPLSDELAAIPVESVRSVAEMIAFEIRVVRGQTTVRAADAYAIARSALSSLRASGELGIDTLNEMDTVALLRHYEIFEATGEDMLGMAHDLVADYLASAPLASRWASHPQALDSTVGEDAWVFAASKVEDPQRSMFMGFVMSVDLILAARCAVQIGGPAIEMVEASVLKSEETGDTLELFCASTAMSIIRSPACLDRLRQRIRNESGESDRRRRAEQALARVGDSAFLSAVLERANRLTSMPFQVSGGDVGLVEDAPPAAILPLARATLRQSAALSWSVASLQTVARFGDASDWDAVQVITQQTRNLAIRFAGVRCLNALDSGRTEVFLSEKVDTAAPPQKLPWLEAICMCDFAFDPSIGIELLLADFDDEDGFDRRRRLVDLFQHAKIRPEHEQVLRASFDSADLHLRMCIWRIARNCSLAAFDELAFTVLRENATGLGVVADFALDRGWPDERAAAFASLCIARSAASEQPHDGDTNRLLFCAIKLGKREEAAPLVSTSLRALLAELLPLEESRRRGVVTPTLHSDAVRHFQLQLQLQSALRPAKEVAAMLPIDVRADLIRAPIMMMNDELRRAWAAIVESLSPSQVDAELDRINSAQDRVYATAQLRELRSVSQRREMFMRDLPAVIGLPTLTESLTGLIMSFWADDILIVLTGIVSSGSLGPMQIEIIGRLVNAVGARLSRDEAERIVEPALVACADHPGRKILQLWLDLASSPLTRRRAAPR